MMIKRIFNSFKKLNVNSFNIRYVSVLPYYYKNSLAELNIYNDYSYIEDEIHDDKDNSYFYDKGKLYIYDNNLDNKLVTYTGSKCNICKGTGWKTHFTTKNDKIKTLNISKNFDYNLCEKCKGIGYL